MRRSFSLAKASRILAALDELASTEAIFLGAGQGGPALAAHERAAPLLAEFCRLMADPEVAVALRHPLAAWLERRRENRDRARQIRSQLKEEGERIAAARQRLARLLPAYSKGRRRPGRLAAAV